MPKPLLVPRRCRHLPECSCVFRRLGETSPRRSHSPNSRMMHGQVPAAGAPHRKPADRQTSWIDRVMPSNMLHCFKHIPFAPKFECVAITAIGMEHKSVGRSKVTVRPLPVGNELQLREMVIASMQPDIQTMRFAALRAEPSGKTR